MGQLICASLSHVHYWYEVGMLKVLAVCVCVCGHHVQRSGYQPDTCVVANPARMVRTFSRLWINLVWLLNLLVVKMNRESFFLYRFAPENSISREGFGCPVLRQPANSPHSG